MNIAENDEKEYLSDLHDERQSFIWCLMKYGKYSLESATEKAFKLYCYEPPTHKYRWLVFHDEAWHWAMLQIFGEGYWAKYPEYESPSKEYRLMQGLSRLMKTFKFKCEQCNEWHEDSPSFGFNAPAHYYSLSDSDKENSLLSNDLCSTVDGNYFIRTILEVPIIDIDEPFMWGVWISVSEKSFNHYTNKKNEDEDEDLTHYFGWFQNRLPYYPDTLNLKTNAYLQPNNHRPILDLEHTDHPLSIDYHQGISWEKAIEITTILLHGRQA